MCACCVCVYVLVERYYTKGEIMKMLLFFCHDYVGVWVYALCVLKGQGLNQRSFKVALLLVNFRDQRIETLVQSITRGVLYIILHCFLSNRTQQIINYNYKAREEQPSKEH